MVVVVVVVVVVVGGWVEGAVSHSARTASIITVFIPGTPLKTAPLQKHAGPKTASGVQSSGPWHPWQASD